MKLESGEQRGNCHYQQGIDGNGTPSITPEIFRRLTECMNESLPLNIRLSS